MGTPATSIVCAAPDHAHQAVEEQSETERGDHDRQDGRILDGTDHDALDCHAPRERNREHDRKRRPERQAVVHQRPGDERRERRHLTLREVDDACRAIDDHDREREACVDRAFAYARGELLRELRPGERAEQHQ
jgi:hypothetical protein